MVQGYMIIIKNEAEDSKNIIEDIRKKITMSTNAQVAISENLISITKETTWAKFSGSINFIKNGKDLEVVYSSSSKWTNTSLVVGCLLFLLTIIGVFLPWYLADKDTSDIDNSVKQILAIASSK